MIGIMVFPIKSWYIFAGHFQDHHVTLSVYKFNIIVLIVRNVFKSYCVWQHTTYTCMHYNQLSTKMARIAKLINCCRRKTRAEPTNQVPEVPLMIKWSLSHQWLSNNTKVKQLGQSNTKLSLFWSNDPTLTSSDRHTFNDKQLTQSHIHNHFHTKMTQGCS